MPKTEFLCENKPKWDPNFLTILYKCTMKIRFFKHKQHDDFSLSNNINLTKKSVSV